MGNTNNNEVRNNENVVASPEPKENGKKPIAVGTISCPGFTGIRLRKEPDLSSETLEVLPEGTSVKMVRRHDAVWSEVEFGHKTGYVQNRFVTTVHINNV